MQRSLYIHLLSLLPWQGEEEALSTEKLLRCSHVSPSPWRRRAERASMTALCVRHAGRGDVMCFSPPPHSTPYPPTAATACVHSAVSQALGVGISLVPTPARADTDCHRRASGVCFHIESEALIAQRQSKVPLFLICIIVVLNPPRDATQLIFFFHD